MSDQPEALFLADVIENDPQSKAHHDAAAAELRRLHALAMDQQGEIYGLNFARETERKIHNLVKAECDALRAENEHLRKTAHEHVSRALYDAHTAELRAEADALRADAERYRWLAIKAHKDTAYDIYRDGAYWRIGFFADDGRHALDAAVDAAREAK